MGLSRPTVYGVTRPTVEGFGAHDWVEIDVPQAVSNADPNSVLSATPTSFASVAVAANAYDSTDPANGAIWVFNAADFLGKRPQGENPCEFEFLLILDTAPTDDDDIVVSMHIQDSTDFTGDGWGGGYSSDSASGAVPRAFRTTAGATTATEGSTPDTAIDRIAISASRSGPEWGTVHAAGLNSSGGIEQFANRGSTNTLAGDLYIIVAVHHLGVSGKARTIGFRCYYRLSPNPPSGWTPAA